MNPTTVWERAETTFAKQALCLAAEMYASARGGDGVDFRDCVDSMRALIAAIDEHYEKVFT